MSAVSLLVTFGTAAATHAAFWQRQGSVWTLEGAFRASAFSCTLLLLLGAHEAGHIVAARLHGVRLGWPMFVPAPLWFGTFGAVLRWPSHPVERRARFAIAAAGPFAGLLAVALVAPLAHNGWPVAGGGTAPVYVESSWLVHRLLSTEPIDPADPLLFAGWVFLWVSSVNLLPFGELDGGHLLRALLPRWHRAGSFTVIGVLAVLGAQWPGWWAWGLAMVLFARSTTADSSRPVPLGASAWSVAAALWTAAALAWMSVPFRL